MNLKKKTLRKFVQEFLQWFPHKLSSGTSPRIPSEFLSNHPPVISMDYFRKSSEDCLRSSSTETFMNFLKDSLRNSSITSFRYYSIWILAGIPQRLPWEISSWILWKLFQRFRLLQVFLNKLILPVFFQVKFGRSHTRNFQEHEMTVCTGKVTRWWWSIAQSLNFCSSPSEILLKLLSRFLQGFSQEILHGTIEYFFFQGSLQKFHEKILQRCRQVNPWKFRQ